MNRFRRGNPAFARMNRAILGEGEALLGKLCLQQGLISREDLTRALTEQEKETESRPPLGAVLLRLQLISSGDLAALLRVQRSREIMHALGETQDLAIPPDVARAELDPLNWIGKYVRTEKLGEGGMAEVWKAWDTQLRRWAAIKILRHASEPEVKRFVREAQVAAKLSHPNIASIFDVGNHAGVHYISMQHVRGKALNQVRLSIDESVHVMRDAAMAVQYAHENGVIHRDLKPGNIMIQAPESAATATPTSTPATARVFVMDFGLAKEIVGDSSLSRPGSLIGTPAYMSPEQARAEGEVDARADVYGLGATMYSMVTGRVPFEGRQMHEVVMKVISEVPPRPRELRSEIPVDVETVILKAMDKDVKTRYATAADFAEDLRRISAGEPILATPPSLFTVAGKFLRRNARTAVFVAAALAAVLMIGAFWLVRSSELATREEALSLLRDAYRKVAAAESAKVRGLESEYGRVRGEIESLLDRCRALDPTLAEADYLRGQVHLMDLNSEQALVWFARALKSDPGLGRAHFGTAMAMLIRSSTLAEFGREHPRLYEEALVRAREHSREPGDRQRAIVLLDILAGKLDAKTTAFLEENRTDLLLLYSAGMAYSAVGRLEEAAKWLTEAIGQRPKMALLLYLRGTVNGLRRKPKDAVRDLTLALESDPDLDKARYNRGIAYLNLAEWLKALDDFDEYIRRRPGDTRAHLHRGYVHLHRHEYGPALSDAGKALDGPETRIQAMILRAQIRLANGESELALADLETAGDGRDARFERGVVLFELARYGDAEAEFDAILREGADAQAFEHRANCRVRMERLEDALRDYEEALRADSSRATVHSSRAQLHLLMGHHALAKADADRAVELQPDLAQHHFVRYDVAVREEDWEQALRSADRTVHLNGSAPAYAIRGIAHAKLVRVGEAKADYTKAIDLAIRKAPRRIPFQMISESGLRLDSRHFLGLVYLYRAYLLRREGDEKGFLRDLDDAEAAAPGLYLVPHARGSFFWLKKRYEEAEAEETKAIQLEARDYSVYMMRATVRIQQIKTKSALEDLTEVIRLRPNWVEGWLNRGRLYRSLKEFDKAVSDFDQCLRIDPNAPGPRYWRGVIHYTRRNMKQAHKDLTIAVRGNPRLGDAHVYLAQINMAWGRMEDAGREFEKAERIVPDSVQLYFARGFFHRTNGDHDKARLDWERVKRLDPSTQAQVDRLLESLDD